MPVAVSFNAPFAEQLEFHRAKLNLPTERYDDILKGAHDRAFIVAGAANADLLNDLNAAITKAIGEGTGLAAFRKDFKSIMLKHGWTGWTGEGSKAGQAWRTKVIYQTNMATSYAAGRWRQLTDPDLLKTRPYWRYCHLDGVLHPRPQHVAWDGLVLPFDHPFWKTHFPPNGWGCHCYVIAVDAAEYAKAQAEGRATPPAGWDQVNPETGTLPGIDRGWAYAPGANAERPLKDLIDQKLINVDASIGASMYEAMAPTLQAERKAAYQEFITEVLADPVKRNRTAVVGAVDQSTLGWLSDQVDVHPVSAEIAVSDSVIIGKKAQRHAAAGDALSDADWARLPDMVAAPDQLLYDTRSDKLLFVDLARDGSSARLAVEFDFKTKKEPGTVNMIVSAFRVAQDSIAGAVKGGIYRVIKGSRE